MNHFLINMRNWVNGFGSRVLLLSCIMLQACNNNDLSDLNDLVNANQQNVSTPVQFDLTLTAGEVVPGPVTDNNNEATASVVFDLGTYAMTAQVSTNKLGSAVLGVQIARGFAGSIGQTVTDLVPSDNPDIWQLPEGFVLAESDVDLMFRGGIYLQANTLNHVQGAVRSQVIIGYQELMINPLSSSQVVGVEVNSSAAGTSYLTVDTLTGDVHGSIWLTEDIVPQQVTLQRGIAGTSGEILLNYVPDGGTAGRWVIPQNSTLPAATIDEVTSAGSYVQIVTSQYAGGELRGQVYPASYYVDVVDLSGANLVPQLMTQASGKAYVTLDGFNGNARAIVTLEDINPSEVLLVRINNLNDTTNNKLIYQLEQHDGDWQLPAGSVFNNSDLVNLGNKRLLFVVISPDFPLGEIGGWL